MDDLYKEKRDAIKDYVNRNKARRDTTEFYKLKYDKLIRENKEYIRRLDKMEKYLEEMQKQVNSLEINVLLDMVRTLETDMDDLLSKI